MSTIEVNLTCRVCLAKAGDFVSMHCTLTVDNIDLGMTLHDCWSYCMRCRREENIADDMDMLPEYICTKCSEDLLVAYNFLKNANEALVILRRQTVVDNCGTVEAEQQPDVGNEGLEMLNQEDKELNVKNFGFPQSVIEEDFLEDIEVKNNEENEEWMLDIEKMIEYDANVDAAGESHESQSVNLKDFEDEDNKVSLPSQRKFRTEEVEDKIEITCFHCKLHFRNYRRFEDHMYEHRAMNPYACCMCTQRLQNVKGMVQHYSKSHRIDPTLEQLQPKACDRDVFGPDNFEPRTIYLCIHCSFEHDEFKVIKQHLRDMHEITDIKHIMKKLPYQCPKCLRCFTSRDKVIKHSEYEHSSITYSTAVRLRKHAICSKCGKKYELSQRKRHELRCDGKTKTYQCKICNGIYANRTTLMAHKREEHPLDPQADSPFRCDICGNTYRTRIQLRFHVKRHDARNFKCNQCSRTFIRHHDLRKHQLIHTGELPYQCNICSASYRYSHALKAHKESIHLNESFICKVPGCEEQFRTRSQLNDHKYKHIGNPYRCEQCPKDFLRRESLRRHYKALHNKCVTEDELTKIYQRHMGRYNTHDIRKMTEFR